MEAFSVVLFTRRFLTRDLDVRSIISRGFSTLCSFKGVYSFTFQAFGRFARRGRALRLSVKHGTDHSRIYDIPGDYAQYASPLLFGVGSLKVIFFRREGFSFRNTLGYGSFSFYNF